MLPKVKRLARYPQRTTELGFATPCRDDAHESRQAEIGLHAVRDIANIPGRTDVVSEVRRVGWRDQRPALGRRAHLPHRRMKAWVGGSRPKSSDRTFSLYSDTPNDLS